MNDPRHDTAMRLSRAGLPIIPLYGPKEGEPAMRGKKPRMMGWSGAKLMPERLEILLQTHPDSNIGCVTGLMSGLVCVDIDPRNGGQAWLQENAWRLIAGQSEETGSGGTHLWFAHPGGWIRSRTGKHGIAPGVELLADGGHQAVIAPSIHHTGALYRWLGTMAFEDVRDFGEALPAWIATPEAAAPTGVRSKRATAEAYGDHPADLEACRGRLAEMEPAVEGAGGNDHTYRVGCLGRDHNLSPEAFFPLLAEWNQRCSPPWDEASLREMMDHGYRYAKAPKAGQRAPSQAFAAIPPGGPVEPEAPPLAPAEAAAQVAEMTSWKDCVVTNRDGTWKSHVQNVLLVLQNTPELAQCFQFNLFTNAVELTAAPWRPWDKLAKLSREWTEEDPVSLAAMIARRPEHPAISPDVVHQAVRPFARLRSFHPVRDFLASLTWDGKPRLDTWTVRYLGAKNTDYARAVGARFLIGAIARVTEPGCKLDTMLVLEGKQGIGKSTAVRILFNPWYTDADLDPANKDTSAIIRGHWGVEFGEMHGARRAEVSQLKAFLSRRSDRQRDAYGRVPETHPRQSVFIGTTNSGDYLLDQTGGRRFWPVACGRIDTERLTADRDQLLAEAFVRYAAGEAWWLEEAEEVDAQAEQAQRRTADEAEDLIAGWLARGGDFGPVGDAAEKVVSPLTMVTGIEVWTGALGGSSVTFKRAEQLRVADCMRAIGWERKVFRRGDMLVKGYASVTTVTNG